MKSIAILYKPKQIEGQPLTELEFDSNLHINYWKLPNPSGNYDRFLDIGIKIMKVSSNLEVLYVYLPFAIKKTDLEDLGARLVENNFIEVLFDEKFDIHSKICPSYSYVGSKDANKSFWLYELKTGNFEVTPLSKGSLISITFKTTPSSSGIIKEKTENEEIASDDYNCYIRFRIKNLKQNDVTVVEPISNDFLQSAFSKSEMFDLHINEIRDIDTSDYEDLINKGFNLKYNIFHFFFVGSSKDETVQGYTDCNDCRLLDLNVWGNYIKGYNTAGKSCIAYHWKPNSQQGKSCVFI